MNAVYLYISGTMTGNSGSSGVKQCDIDDRGDHAYGGMINSANVVVLINPLMDCHNLPFFWPACALSIVRRIKVIISTTIIIGVKPP